MVSKKKYWKRNDKCGKNIKHDESAYVAEGLLTFGYGSLMEQPCNLFIICVKAASVPNNWNNCFFVPFRQRERYWVQRYCRIHLLSIPCEVFCRILIKMMQEGTKSTFWEERCGFMLRRRCAKQIFAVLQGHAKLKNVYFWERKSLIWLKKSLY